MREEFSKKTKDILAKRVGYKCSFPGCNRNTIGKSNKSNDSVINLGEAAHIYAASINGPRYNDKMSKEERVSTENGIWMCRQHARIIDADYINYSPSTLLQWKENAENDNYKLLQNLDKNKISSISTTFIQLGENLIVEGFWKFINEDIWGFEISNFIVGGINELIKFSEINYNYKKYIIIESQGDGRIIKDKFSWELLNNGNYEISLNTNNKFLRDTPYKFSDISSDFEIVNGDFKIVKGEECAKQIITNMLSISEGDLMFSPIFYSLFSTYFNEFNDNISLLERLIKLELIRLLSIPLENNSEPPLNFINRIIKVTIVSNVPKNNKIPINIELEWGDGKNWINDFEIFIKQN